MNILVFLFILATLPMYLSAADQQLRLHTLPAELNQKIVSDTDIALTNGTPSQYTALRDTDNKEERQRFYVNHLLIALHFWNTELMNDIVAFEIGRFRKKPELIFALKKNEWSNALLSVNYLKRNGANQTTVNDFLNNFTDCMRKVNGNCYYTFLPPRLLEHTENDGHPHIEYKYQYPILFISPFKILWHMRQPSIVQGSSKGVRMDTVARSETVFVSHLSHTKTKEPSPLTLLPNHWGESYELSYNFYKFDKYLNTFWDWDRSQIVVTENNGMQYKFPTLPHSIKNGSERLFIEALIGFSKKEENTKTWFYSPRFLLQRLLHQTHFTKKERKNLKSIIYTALRPQSKLEYSSDCIKTVLHVGKLFLRDIICPVIPLYLLPIYPSIKMVVTYLYMVIYAMSKCGHSDVGRHYYLPIINCGE